MRFLRRAGAILALLAALAGLPAAAQDGHWVQIEARPTLGQAEARARAWAERLDGVAGFRLPSGWYAIVLGPYAEAEAEARRRSLLARRTIPGDAFLAEGRGFRDQFWPLGDGGVPIDPVAVPVPPEAPRDPAGAGPDGEVAESLAGARAAERRLSRREREEVQGALGAAGFYDAAIDGDFGPGTRRAMAEWQAARGFEATGVLTTRQRGALFAERREARASLGIETVTDAVAGIRADLPLGRVARAGAEPPFVRYEGADGARVLLISQRGDVRALRGLFDVMQSLSIVPAEGDRAVEGHLFKITGADARIVTHVEAQATADGAIKGFALVWPAGDGLRREMALAALTESFAPLPGAVLPDAAAPDAGGAATPAGDLLSGLEVRRPKVSASGFYVSGAGAVLTAAAAVEGCGRVTLDGTTPARVAARDTGTGLALLEPEARLVPPGIARVEDGALRPPAEVALAGFSWGGALRTPTVSFGTLEDRRGLRGETGLARLALAAEPGDVGGPVLDAGGGVVGLLLPRPETGKVLPPEVQFAADGARLADFLAAQGVAAAGPDAGSALAPEDLARLGAGMTVLVECWE